MKKKRGEGLMEKKKENSHNREGPISSERRELRRGVFLGEEGGKTSTPSHLTKSIF